MPSAGEQSTIETLAAMIGKQRRQADDVQDQLRSVLTRIGGLDAGVGTRLSAMERALERTHKSVSSLHIGSRLSTQSSTYPLAVSASSAMPRCASSSSPATMPCAPGSGSTARAGSDRSWKMARSLS